MTPSRGTKQNGSTYFELHTVLALLALLAGLIVVPSYRAFGAARAAHEAVLTLAQDLELLERTAQNGSFFEGSSLVVNSADPLSYTCYRGRPSSVDPRSKLAGIIVDRRFEGVRLVGGPIDTSTPLLFASNGSAQYFANGTIATQHQVIAFALTPSAAPSRLAQVLLNLYTGAISTP